MCILLPARSPICLFASCCLSLSQLAEALEKVVSDRNALEEATNLRETQQRQEIDTIERELNKAVAKKE